MLKKIISLITAAAIAAVSVTAFASDRSGAPSYDAERYTLARELIGQITDAEDILSEPEAHITREQFVAEVCKVMGYEPENGAEQIYNDVSKTNENFGYIAAACRRGLITAAERFNRSDEITVNEALKIMMCAFDCGDIAAIYGGYPSGYRNLADRLGVLKGISGGFDGSITNAEVCIMLRNLLLANSIEIDEISGGAKTSVTYEKKTELNIKKYFGLDDFEGIITETAYSSMVLGTGINKGEYIGVDGSSYHSGYFGEEYLGLNAEVYVDGDNTVRAVVPTGNTTAEIKLDDYEKIENGNIFYENADGKRRSERLSGAYVIIYNGRRIETLSDDMLDGMTGSVTLLDNNGDGRYEAVFFSAYSYELTENVDYPNGYIGIKNSAAVDIDRDDVGFVCKNTDGETVNPYDLRNGDPVALRKSADGYLVSVILLDKTAEGILSAISDDGIEIDGVPYDASDRLLEKDADKLKLNSPIKAAIGIFGEAAIVCDTVRTLGYGYAVEWASGTNPLSDELRIKMLTRNDEIEIYDFADSVKIDGKSVKINKAAQALTDASFAKGLVKYALDSEGNLNEIYLPKDAADAAALGDSDVPVRNYSAVSGYYRSASRAFVPYATVSSAVMFNVPTNAGADDDDYSVIAISDIMGNTRHTLDLYDIDSYGYAGAAVLYDSDAAKINYTSQSYMVKNVVSMMNENGDTGKGIKCWGTDGFETLFIPSDVSIKKSTGKPISCGDIIRIKKRGSEIKSVITDIDMADGTPKLDASSTADMNVIPANISYNTGYVYSCSDNSICLSESRDNGLKVNPTDMRYFYIPTSAKAVRLNVSKKTLESADIGDIHSVIGFGSGADYAIIRQVNDSTALIFIIE